MPDPTPPPPPRPTVCWAVVGPAGDVILGTLSTTRRNAVAIFADGWRGDPEGDTWPELRRRLGVRVERVRVTPIGGPDA